MDELLIYDFAETERFAVLETESTVRGEILVSARREGERNLLWISYAPTHDADSEAGPPARIVLLLPSAGVRGRASLLLLDVLGGRGEFDAAIQAVDGHGRVREFAFERGGPGSARILRAPIEVGGSEATSAKRGRAGREQLQFHRLIIRLVQPDTLLELGLQRLLAVGKLRHLATGESSGSRAIGRRAE